MDRLYQGYKVRYYNPYMPKRKRGNNGYPARKRRRVYYGRTRTYSRRNRFRSNRRTGGFLGIETKFYDQKLVAKALIATADGSGIETDPSATILLNTTTQGDGEQQRDGRRMIMKSIFVTGTVTIPPAGDQTVNESVPNISIWMVLDTQTNGATIVSENVFLNPTADGQGATSLLRNLQFSSRFKILAKTNFTMPTPSTAGDSTNFDQQGVTRKWSMYVDLKNLPVLFSNTTETVANITDNSLHILASATSTTMGPVLTYNSRLRFVG